MELCLEHISREFKDKKAVDDVSLRIWSRRLGASGSQRRGKNNADAYDSWYFKARFRTDNL